MESVAFVGLGAMGSRMARRLIDAGYELVVWNRTAEKAQPLVDAGAHAAATAAEAARAADLVITMLANPDALRSTVEGPGGVAEGLRPDSTCVEMSTVGPTTVRWLRSAVPSATALVDAPVVGSIAEAAEGRLKIFVGGAQADRARVLPMLGVLGKPIEVGDLGAGAASKLVANAALVGVISLLGETFALGRSLGLDDPTLFEVLAATALAQQAERRRSAIEHDEYEPRFALYLARKDADLVMAAADSASLDARVLGAVRTWFADAEEAGRGDLDYSAVLAQILGQHLK